MRRPFHYSRGPPALGRNGSLLGVPLALPTVDFAGFESAIDALGGITVDAPAPLIDREFPTADYGRMTIYFPAGQQRLDGHQALIYARSRHSDSDLERGRRQQSVLLGAREEALQLGVLPRLPALLQTLQAAVVTDMPAGEMLRLARALPRIDRDRIVSRAFDATLCDGQTTALGASILIPRWPAIRAVTREMFPDGASPVDRSS